VPTERSETLRALREAAETAARGELVARVPVPPGDDELAGLAVAFNDMLDQLESRVLELEQRPSHVVQALRRLGDALAATHDRTAIIESVVETSMLTLRARAAVFYELEPGDRLRAATVCGDADPRVTLGLGEGLAGRAAEGKTAIVWPGRAEPAAHEPVPEAATALAVPVRLRARLLGVLALYGRHVSWPFNEDDVDMLETLAHQAEIAVDNAFLYEDAARMSITDGLTGLWNRRHFELQATQELARSRRFGEPLGMLMIDVDHFKSINDELGHQAGDAVLIEVASRLTGMVREVDLMARYGGEEFGALLPKTDLQGAGALADRIRAAIANERFAVDGRALEITVSIGAAVHPDHGDTLVTLLAAADVALYRAKALGRNRVESAESGPPIAASAAGGN
jgi:two-component system cell cycle response regulator